MEKLLQLSKEIDEGELYPLVKQVCGLCTDPAPLVNVHRSCDQAKHKSKQQSLVNFFAALSEAVGVFNDFSQLDTATQKEMLQSCRDSVQFYLNRILKVAKEQNIPSQIEWAKEFEGFLKSQRGNMSGKALLAETTQKTEQISLVSQAQPNVPKQVPAARLPKIALQGNIWYIENQIDNSSIEIEVKEMQQRIVIVDSQRSIVKIKGKCTAISVEKGKSLGVVVEDVIVSTFELLNSSKIQVQLSATCPTMTIDNCEGVQVFLGSAVHENFELLTCKANEINLYKQVSKEPCEFSNEIPVPEQFKSRFDSKTGNLVTEPVKHTAV